jgi:hypothetical protein
MPHKGDRQLVSLADDSRGNSGISDVAAPAAWLLLSETGTVNDASALQMTAGLRW